MTLGVFSLIVEPGLTRIFIVSNFDGWLFQIDVIQHFQQPLAPP